MMHERRPWRALLLVYCSLKAAESWLVRYPRIQIRENGRRLSALDRGSPRREAPLPDHVALYAIPSLSLIAAAGISDSELGAVREAITLVCQDQDVAVQQSAESDDIPLLPSVVPIPGATGRILLLRPQNMSEVEDLKNAISFELDEQAHKGRLDQPILVCIRDENVQAKMEDYLASLVQQEVEMYEMRVPLPSNTKPFTNEHRLVPSIDIELDGANVSDVTGRSFWDTSTVLVFDHLVSDDLRKRLLDVVLGRSEDEIDVWDDVQKGPDPQRWIRGGLVDLADGDDPRNSPENGQSWGLTEDAIVELCFEHHDALQEFETILSELFLDYIVSRLPEAVLGSHVTPLTANSPTAGDQFDYHIDADPMLAPPSPWTDVFGRYPNRCHGKPRFMSCLIYVNDEWDHGSWGAPTRFLDVATDKHHDVQAKPGRCVIMDQDITHTVMAPNEDAGKRPRYSLVWKLILHPKRQDQDMTQLAGQRSAAWPRPLMFGSAAKDSHEATETGG